MSELRRKLIEVSLPLEAISRESAREKSIRHGHPSTLHMWWARRPLASARAVLFAQLVDDPSAHPELFPTLEAQATERARLHSLIEEFVTWEASTDRSLFQKARAEIAKSCGPEVPPILDPFAGGGTIPLEAQRLGLSSMASDLNPVAVLINKAMLEIPGEFRNQPPMSRRDDPPTMLGTQWQGAQGLAADVRHYASWMRDRAWERIGQHYPEVALPSRDGGGSSPGIAWLWARTVTCSNPSCGTTVPLIHSLALSKRNGGFWLRPHPVKGERRIAFEIVSGGKPPSGNTGRNGVRCFACDASMSLSLIREMAIAGKMGIQLVVTVAEGKRKRIYVDPSPLQQAASEVHPPGDVPETQIPLISGIFNTPLYGIDKHRELFTPRQLLAMTTFSDLVEEAREQVEKDGGSPEYGRAVATYLALSVGRLANRCSSQCFWSVQGQKIDPVFARNALPMVWFFAEANPFSSSSGNFMGQVDYLVKALAALPAGTDSSVTQHDAAESRSAGRYIVATDPPYYNNIPYADLSDFFYIWLKRSLPGQHEDIFRTILVPKAAELIADPTRQGGKEAAATFFERGIEAAFEQLLAGQDPDFPMTIFYAYKQTESADTDGIRVSTGWETMLQGLINAGAVITGAWPIRTERAGGLRDFERAALNSSIVLVCRKRPDDASSVSRRDFIKALEGELPSAVRDLQVANIAPVDLPQAAIGPGMAIYSRHASVIEDDGSPMSVRSGLASINEILDRVLNEQEGDFDAVTRFCISWYRYNGYQYGRFGEADDLARARNTAVDAMDRAGVLVSRAGKVALLAPSVLPTDYDVVADEHISVWETLHHASRILESGGISAAGAFIAACGSRADGGIELDLIKELSFLLFAIAEKNKWTKDALSFNSVATSWPEIIEASRNLVVEPANQSSFDYTSGDD